MGAGLLDDVVGKRPLPNPEEERSKVEKKVLIYKKQLPAWLTLMHNSRLGF